MQRPVSVLTLSVTLEQLATSTTTARQGKARKATSTACGVSEAVREDGVRERTVPPYMKA